jgi:hypothetical protein
MPPLTLRTPQDDCVYCQRVHAGKCPLIKSISYHADGTIASVEFHEHTPRTPSSELHRGAHSTRYPGEEPLRK